MEYEVTVKIHISADSQGEALQTIEQRVRANGTSEPIPARVFETVKIVKAGQK